jgi:hypothetical protein
VLHGEVAADKVDSSRKWFADTHLEIERYEKELSAGNTVLSVPVKDSRAREQIHDILQRHDARMMTHFGEWITETMQ